jgi:hypothetical protein
MSDAWALGAVQVVLFLLLLRALLERLLRRNEVAKAVRRGPKSRRQFGVAYGFGSVILLQLVNASAAFSGHKVLLSTIDLAVFFYLCFFSGWFRNNLTGWFGRWDQDEEVSGGGLT